MTQHRLSPWARAPAKQQARANREPVEFPKYIKVDGRDVLALNAEHEAELLAANGTCATGDRALAHAGESTSDSEQLVRTSPERIGVPAIDKPHVLLPFDIREALSISDAARIAGRRPVTVREWAANYDIGRRVGGRWMVSRVALAMHLDNDRNALKAYLAGDRESETVTGYFRRFGLDPRKI
jgi:hypothetical protein